MAVTIGELKKHIIEQGGAWEVDPRLSDDDPLPELPLGGQSEEEIPDHDRLKPAGRRFDVEEMVRKDPPDNPWLLAHLVESGVLDRSALEGVVPMKDDDKFGAS